MASVHLVLVGFGPHAQEKHLPLIRRADAAGMFNGFSVIELESCRAATLRRLAHSDPSPDEMLFVPDRRAHGLWFVDESSRALESLRRRHPSIRVLVATEPKAHYGYVRWCLEHGIDCLVDKPLTAPVSPDGRFLPHEVYREYAELLELGIENGASCTIMAPRRYHRLHQQFYRYLRLYVLRYKNPVTYLSIYHGEGVCNRVAEIESREDHPYKYGYGMLMHSGYHYVDLASSILELNHLVYSPDDLEIDVQTIHALPTDPVHQSVLGGPPKRGVPNGSFGESDICAQLRVRLRRTREVVTLGNLNLIQSSASLRSWKELPKDVYNKNGRYSLEEIRVNVGFLLSLTLIIYKVPVRISSQSIEFRYEHQLLIHRNSNVTGAPAFRRKLFPDSPNNDQHSPLAIAKWQMFSNWLSGRENRSQISQHRLSVKLLELLLLSIDRCLRD